MKKIFLVIFLLVAGAASCVQAMELTTTWRNDGTEKLANYIFNDTRIVVRVLLDQVGEVREERFAFSVRKDNGSHAIGFVRNFETGEETVTSCETERDKRRLHEVLEAYDVMKTEAVDR